MNFEKPQFDKLGSSPERQEKKMPPEEAEKMLGEMDEYAAGLKTLLEEKQGELKQVQEDPGDNREEIDLLTLEIGELEEQISGLEEFSDEGKEEGAEFFEK